MEVPFHFHLFVCPPLPEKIKIKKKCDVISDVTLTLPGSKSVTNRAVVLAGMQRNPLKLSGFLFAEDTYWGLVALQTLGFQIEIDATTKSVVISPPMASTKLPEKPEIFLGKAGTLARFFPAVILNWNQIFPDTTLTSVTLNSDVQLTQRPLVDLICALRQLGGKITGDSLPLEIFPSKLTGHCSISGNKSGQFLSGLLLASYGSKEKISIQRTENLVQPQYVKITQHMITEFGGHITATDELVNFQTYPREKNFLGCSTYEIEADASTACYFFALGFLHHFSITVTNLGSKTLQPDYKFLDVLKQWGANISSEGNSTSLIQNYSKTAAAISQSTPTQTFNFSEMSDQALTLGTLALILQIPVKIFGIAHIRNHESDRIACFIKNANQLGFSVQENHDGFETFRAPRKKTDVQLWETHNDHRFAFCGALVASVYPDILITNPRCVEKTCPQFFLELEKIGFSTILT